VVLQVTPAAVEGVEVVVVCVVAVAGAAVVPDKELAKRAAELRAGRGEVVEVVVAVRMLVPPVVQVAEVVAVPVA